MCFVHGTVHYNVFCMEWLHPLVGWNVADNCTFCLLLGMAVGVFWIHCKVASLSGQGVNERAAGFQEW